jgi:glutamate 5-kinase
MKGTKEIVPVVEKITPEIEAMAGGTTSETATGGMISKISAAKLATRSGCGVFIASGAEPDILPRLFSGQGPGTFFVPAGIPMESKKRWLAYYQRPTGTIFVNACAVPVLRDQGRSLLAVGITRVKGTFAPGDIVNIAFDGTGESSVEKNATFARGKVAYSNDEVTAIAGKHGDEVRALYPSRKRLDVIHRDDLALL